MPADPSELRQHSPVRLHQVGEFGLIQGIQQLVDARGGEGRSSVELGIGDDAAVWRPRPGTSQVITTDALIEDVHFRVSTSSWRDLGWKALAVNVSDIAGMGAAPRLALVSLGLPGHTLVSDVLQLYEGMLDLAEDLAVSLAGGDVVLAPVIMLNVTVVGEATAGLLRRDAGRPGDVVAVTGSLGASVGGLKLLESGRRPGQGADRLFQAQLRPQPRVREAAVLARCGVVCGMDVSDGLVGDLAHIAERSGVSVELVVESVPVDDALRQEFGEAALTMALGGGEDYEILCAAPSSVVERAQAELEAIGVPLTIIGRLRGQTPGEAPVRLIDAMGGEQPLPALSWDHFRD